MVVPDVECAMCYSASCLSFICLWKLWFENENFVQFVLKYNALLTWKKDWMGVCFIASIEIQDSDLYNPAEVVSILESFGSPITHIYTEGLLSWERCLKHHCFSGKKFGNHDYQTLNNLGGWADTVPHPGFAASFLDVKTWRKKVKGHCKVS